MTETYEWRGLPSLHSGYVTKAMRALWLNQTYERELREWGELWGEILWSNVPPSSETLDAVFQAWREWWGHD